MRLERGEDLGEVSREVGREWPRPRLPRTPPGLNPLTFRFPEPTIWGAQASRFLHASLRRPQCLRLPPSRTGPFPPSHEHQGVRDDR